MTRRICANAVACGSNMLTLKTVTSVTAGVAAPVCTYDIDLVGDQLMQSALEQLGPLAPGNTPINLLSLFLVISVTDPDFPGPGVFLDPPDRVILYLSWSDSLRSAGASPRMTLCVLSEPQYPKFLVMPSVHRILRPGADFEFVSRLRSGAFGDVSLVRDKVSNIQYACKAIRKVHCDTNVKRVMARETTIQSMVNHRAVVPLRAMSIDWEGGAPLLYLDCFRNGSLHDYTKSQPALTPTQKMIIIVWVACGMQYLHSLNVQHRDLKPMNVVLDDQLRPLRTDFGESKDVSPSDPASGTMNLGTCGYCEPEQTEGAHYSAAVDVFAFTVLV
jgi:hypothetical protein